MLEKSDSVIVQILLIPRSVSNSRVLLCRCVSMFLCLCVVHVCMLWTCVRVCACSYLCLCIRAFALARVFMCLFVSTLSVALVCSQDLETGASCWKKHSITPIQVCLPS
jgi:hypothetical protein